MAPSHRVDTRATVPGARYTAEHQTDRQGRDAEYSLSALQFMSFHRPSFCTVDAGSERMETSFPLTNVMILLY